MELRSDMLSVKGNHAIQRRLTFQGMKIAIETDKGQMRHWHDPESGHHGSTVMHYPYGYFEGTRRFEQAGDNMALDVYVGPDEDAKDVYVVHQMKRPEFKEFDELKCMVGFESEKHARISYLMHYNDDRFLGSMDTLTVEEFKHKYIHDAEKALYSGPVGQPEQWPNRNMIPEGQIGTLMAPQMPMMPMMPMGPPPIDVETREGVDALLGRIGKMKDTELLNVAEEIWGPGYQYMHATPEHVRCEVTGFLLDQRDLLGVSMEDPTDLSPSSPVQTSSPSSQTSSAGATNDVSPSVGVNSFAAASGSPPSMASSQQAPSKNNEADPFAGIG